MKIKHLLLFIILLGVIYCNYIGITETRHIPKKLYTYFDIFILFVCVITWFLVVFGIIPLIFYLQEHSNFFKICKKILNTNLTLKQ